MDPRRGHARSATVGFCRLLAASNTWVAGAAGTVLVSATDAYGDTISNFSGTITFGSSAPAAALPAPCQFVPADGGTKVFALIMRTAGVQSLTEAHRASTWETISRRSPSESDVHRSP